MNNDIIKKILKLPDVLIEIIKNFLPRKFLIFTNKDNYILYHSLIRNDILNYENYIRDIIRRDNIFVFKMIIFENLERWLVNKDYYYKKTIFKNYMYFVIYYCIENESNNCRNYLINFLKEHGLCKNQHKKNIIKNIISHGRT